jgi:hypothetical protein
MRVTGGEESSVSAMAAGDADTLRGARAAGTETAHGALLLACAADVGA